ncbi:hypothetical protein [Bacteroides bouchesdurhonensis]|uniref:hypothetical protein n=1 Tax=Bacteroides bouchesdurhonensis TaxID=1841855 RepID=UPI0011DC7916|nr:hypothetical protein [Bacteroides bouchesdurhonensis]
MKRLFLNFMVVAVATTTFVLTSCGSDDNNGDKPENSIVVNGNTLRGTLTENEILEAKEYYLDGSLIIADGGVLTIPAGTTIKAKQGFGNYLLVTQGGRIYANGTKEKPITFTADAVQPSSGYWGGVIINGKAPISGISQNASDLGLTEINNDYQYGGSITNDNSGSLTYVKICYAGARSTENIEHNGLTLNGVGNGTKIDNIYILESADDAVEFFGGTVNVTNLLAVNPDDDMFDFTQGYSGKLSNCYGIWENRYTSTEDDPRGIEADGNLDGDGEDHLRQANFIVENMTIVNNAADTQNKVDRMVDVIKIRRGAKATISNVLIAGTGGTQDLIDMTDSKGDGNVTSSITYTLASTFTVHDKVLNGTANVAANNSCTGAAISVFDWTNYTFPILVH